MDIFGNFPRKIGKIKSDLSEYEHPAEMEAKDVLEEKELSSSFPFYYLLVFILSLVLVFRLLNLQIAQGEKFQYLAEGNRIRSKLIEAPRGIIYDRNNNILAKNSSSFSLEIYPADLSWDSEDREKVYQTLKENSDIDIDGLRKQIDEKGLYSLEPIVLAENLSRDQALLLKVKYSGLSGVVVAARPVREYQKLSSLAHILGYVGKIDQEELAANSAYKITDRIGKNGLELVSEQDLKGKDGQDQVEVDSRGRIQRVLSALEPVAGQNVMLSLDLNLQKKMEESLNAMAEKSSQKAVAIVIDPQTGGILGALSLPGYDNNIFSQADFNEDYQKLVDDSQKPLLNRFTSGVYPSGSTIKPYLAAAGLQEKVISENTTINDPGEIKIGQWVFPDWKNHGLVNVRKAIAESCNVFFYALGGGWDKIQGLGVKRIKNYLEKFGFGTETKIDLPSEEKGLIPDPDWKKETKKEPWYIGDTYHLAIGQGDIGVTPIQLAAALTAVANGGKLLRPHFVEKIVDTNGKEIKKIEPEILRKDFIDAYNMQIVREGMRQAVTDGSARQLADLQDKNGNSIKAAGKTGTAQFGPSTPRQAQGRPEQSRGTTSSGQVLKTHAWFTAFAPYDDPEIALVVLIEEGGEGNETAVPVAKDILQYWFNK